MSAPGPAATFRFRDYELDVGAYELRRRGRAVRLERRPMDLLILLVGRRRQLVSRGDIIDRLWGKDVFVDVETGVNTVVFKLRQALRDSPDTPAFIETVPGRGYRFIADVEAVEAAPAPDAQRPDIVLAVLPFENLTGQAERDYLADGLAEETIASLGQVDARRLAVIGRTSTMAYKRTTKSLAEIGRELGVDYLVESSIRSEGERLRVTCKLIRARDQVQVWSESYDRAATSILGLERELSTAIAAQIRLRLSPERLEALARRQTDHAEAYDLYLRGRYLWYQLTPPTTRRAIEYYERATERDPGYALAWSGLADALATSPINGDARPRDVWPRAREAAQRAVAAAPDLAEAQASLGLVSFFLEWDWPAAERAWRRATLLDSGSAQAHRFLATVLSHTGRHEEAEQEMQRALALDPLYAMLRAMASQNAFQARDNRAALEHARRAIALDAEFWIGHVQRGQAHAQLGETDLALEAFTAAARLSGGNSKALALRGHALATAGRTSEAREVLEALESISETRYVPPYAFALVHAGLGAEGEALAWLERGYDARDVHLIFLTVDPKWDSYRTDPRFEALLTRCDFMRTTAGTSRTARPSS
ncbi:MAG: hypothetical protein DMF78_00525 [Acidobacteria bacterium]|nr:MAG: hypothetical protein DMF78_00525 [Acidobacteriota bacterium]